MCIRDRDTTDLRSLKNLDLKKYDLIISSIKLDYDLEIPVVYVDIIFSQNDLDNLKLAFEDKRLAKIYDLFNNSIFIRTSQFKNKLEILKYISECIEEKSAMNKDLALKQLKQREDMGYTLFNQIAIPHILDQVDGDSYSIIIVLDNPVKWNESCARLVYSLIIGKELADMSLYYEKLGLFLSNHKSVTRALEANNQMDFMNIFLNI